VADEDWQDKARSLAVFFGIGCALIGYAGGGPGGAVAGFAAGWGLGYLVALFFRHLAVFIGSGIALVGIAALIVGRVGYIEKRIAPKEATGDGLESIDSLPAPAGMVIFFNQCKYDVSLRVRWQNGAGRWQWNGPWQVPPDSAKGLTLPDDTVIETGQSEVIYIREALATDPRPVYTSVHIKPAVPASEHRPPKEIAATMRVEKGKNGDDFWLLDPPCG
jgi:hypothetical protein